MIEVSKQKYVDAELLKAYINQIIDSRKERKQEPCIDDLYSILGRLVQMTEIQLPSDIKDAAEDYCLGYPVLVEDRDGELMETYDPITDAFRAGAEWMAGRGITIERTIDDFGDGPSIKPCTEMELDHLGAMLGDKVIVQIRRKVIVQIRRNETNS